AVHAANLPAHLRTRFALLPLEIFGGHASRIVKRSRKDPKSLRSSYGFACLRSSPKRQSPVNREAAGLWRVVLWRVVLAVKRAGNKKARRVGLGFSRAVR